MSTVLAGLNCIQASQDTSRDQRVNAIPRKQTFHINLCADISLAPYFFLTFLKMCLVSQLDSLSK